MTLVALTVAAAIAGQPAAAPSAQPSATATPADMRQAIDQAVRKEKLTDTRPKKVSATPRPSAETALPRYEQEITVAEWWRDVVLIPDYKSMSLGRPIRYFGVPRGGQAGSISFDPVARKYWWQ